MAKNLVIVESPAKAKTIEKYLGKDFTVRASYGHIRDLPKGDKAIDVENGFEPTYEIPSDKQKVVRELRELAKQSEQVWLATDEDREGEAISWHLAEVLKLDVQRTRRIVFHEITQKAIQHAVENPRTIDMNLVDAQQARRVLDRVVGFELSPILWKKVRAGLSAGRVQSVAVRLVVEREREILDFQTKSFYRTIARLLTQKKEKFKAELQKDFETEAEATQFLELCKGAKYSVASVEVKPAKRTPAAPFTTSTLQQEASRKLGFNVKRTMQVAQSLYEEGYITYMRTDSVSLSDFALFAAKKHIEDSYGDKYHKLRKYKTKSANAQEAHEAIRPTDFNTQNVPGDNDRQRLYSLIWKRTVASQMADAELERTIALIDINPLTGALEGTPYKNQAALPKLKAEGEVLIFDGFLRLYPETKTEEDDESGEMSILPELKPQDVVEAISLTATQKFTRPAARFTEAALVKKLEELGVGRPSTYASTITTIQNREYVVKENRDGEQREYRLLVLEGDKIRTTTEKETVGTEKNKFFPTDLGTLVTGFLTEYFTNVVDTKFTARVEEEFDEISRGELAYGDMLQRFYSPFHEQVENTLQNASRVAGERVLGDDPTTGKPVIARLGKYGPLVQLGGSEDLEKRFANLTSNYRLESITLEQALKLFGEGREVGLDPATGKTLYARLARYGPVVQLGTSDDPEKRYANLPKHLSMDTITLEQALPLLALPRIVGKLDDQIIKANVGRFGPYLQIDKLFASIPKHLDPYTITYEEAVAVIELKKKADIDKILKVYEGSIYKIVKGRWGPFLQAGDDQVRLPKNVECETLTLEDCIKLHEASPKIGKGKGAKGKARGPIDAKAKVAKPKTTTRATKAKGSASPRAAKPDSLKVKAAKPAAKASTTKKK
jgi:DNA topoisomerase I